MQVDRAHPLPIYYQDEFLVVKEPESPLAPGAVEIVVDESKCNAPEITYRKIYSVYQRLKNYWSSNALAKGSYYLERRDEKTGATFRQIIPYSRGGLRSTCRQIQVTWNLICPKLAWTKHQVLGDEKSLTAALKSQELQETITQAAQTGKDPFCRPDRIKAQQIMEGKDIRILYNFKPLATHDLLFTAKNHSPVFDEEAFIEAMSLGQKAHKEYTKRGFAIMYLTMADHPFAGQTVPHAHVHATYAKDFREELLGIATVVRKILIDSWLDLTPFSPFRLSDKQLAVIISEEKEILKCLGP